jgi:hypothetical protein
MQSWLSHHVALITEVSILAALCTIAEFVWKPIRSVISLFRSLPQRMPTNAETIAPSLRFVPIRKECRFAATISAAEGQPNAQIVTTWNVTNISTSGIPAKLLEARLTKPRAKEMKFSHISTGSINGSMGAEYEVVPPGAMRRLTIVFLVVLPAEILRSPIKAKIILEDNFSRQHKLRPIEINPTIITATNTTTPQN